MFLCARTRGKVCEGTPSAPRCHASPAKNSEKHGYTIIAGLISRQWNNQCNSIDGTASINFPRHYTRRMAFASLLTLLDDIATTLDDVAVMTKLAAKKTAGILGDDLAVNAEQVTGSAAERELPIVFKVALGSLVNKAILVPLALLLSAFAPWAIVPLLMVMVIAFWLMSCIVVVAPSETALRERFLEKYRLAAYTARFRREQSFSSP